jgi:hypothetical protein
MTCEVCGRESAPWSMTDPGTDKKCHRGYANQAVLDRVECYRLGYERVVKVLLDAPHGFMCRSSRVNRIQQDTPSSAAFPQVISFTSGEPHEEQHCNCWKRAAIALGKTP